MIWIGRKYITATATVVVATFMSMAPVKAADATITLNVPVKVQNIMEGVIVQLNCSIINFTGQSTPQLGESVISLPLIDGKVNETFQIIISPIAGQSFTTANYYSCALLLKKDNFIVNNILAAGCGSSGVR